MKRLRPTLWLLFLLPLAAAPATPTTSPWTVDDVIGAKAASGWALSPDGTRGLWLERVLDSEKDQFFSRLQLLDVATAKSRPLTVGTENVSSPRFTPAGDAIVYLSTRDLPAGGKPPPEDEKGPQLWRLDLSGGEARPLTTVPFGVRSFHFLDDGSIVYSARGRRSARERETKERKDDTIVVEDPVAMVDEGSALHRLSPDGERTERILEPAEGPIESFAVSPNGRFAVTAHSRSPSYEAEGKVPPGWVLRDLTAGTAVEIFGDTRTKPLGALWRRDSSSCFLVWPHSSRDGETMASVQILKELDPATGAITDFPLEWEQGLAFGTLEITADGLVASLANGVSHRHARYVRGAAGVTREWIDGGGRGGFHSITLARDAETCLFSAGDASTPAAVRIGTLRGAVLEPGAEAWNAGFETKVKARTEVVRWAGALGEEVEGILYYPHGWTEGTRSPVIALTHGGPHGADYDRFEEDWAAAPNLYAERGAFVLKTNYHGSSDYGLAWGESIRAKYYELEVEDILAGIQSLVDQGKADPARVGLIGWSNGAILTIACLTHAHRYAPGHDFTFTACAPGAGDVNWTSDYGNCAFGGTFDDYYLGGPPWTHLETYIEKSPLFEVERVTTPTIIFFGTEDTSVPTSQGWEWYRALHSVGKAPVRFLLFPGEPHGLRKPSHQRRKLAEELAWFEKHYFGKPETPLEAPKESEIARAKLFAAAARDGEGRLGVLAGDRLVPETVPFGTGPAPFSAVKSISRFEVTVDQWRAFDPDFANGVPAALHAHGSHPATSLADAAVERYLAWLSEATRADWRLPTEEELDQLAKKASGGNTLDRWVGHAPAAAEADRYAEMVAALGLAEALAEVGEHAPALIEHGGKEQAVYDLVGNAAERVKKPDGAIVPAGGHALASPDPLDPTPPPPPPEYVGLRLVREERAAPQ